MLYIEYAVNDALVASHIFLRKEKRRLSKKRRTVKRNAVQGIQRSHKCLAKVAQKGNHLFFLIV